MKGGYDYNVGLTGCEAISKAVMESTYRSHFEAGHRTHDVGNCFTPDSRVVYFEIA